MFDFENKKKQLSKINKVITEENFWTTNPNAQNIVKNASNIEKIVNLLEVIEVEIKDLEEFIELSKDNQSELDEIKNQFIDTEQKIIDLEEESLYSEEFDNHSAVLTVNAGAGGVDAHDWAEMLFRMYTRFLDNNNMKYEIEEISTGEEAGIKSGSIRIDNYRAYANLESERGVHRLVRISPFDSNKRRHTSFAGVDVVPLIDDSDEFDLNDDDIRIDVYRSSGAGGQHVNTTDSAVRVTHIPTGIVVACQAERSQLQNKIRALALLKSKLILLEKEEKLKKLDSIRGEQVEAGWGRQIRSYVMQPYQQVKDSRTNIEVGNIHSVLDGDINIFINEYLKWRRQGLND
ncbi:peptide chain release factor 2 [Acidimicrobiaceae bacterium]|nr:peptide chain release factor 2 [Acidimicrobiaceae bacterium]